MEILETQRSEFNDLIQANPEGLSFEELYIRLTGFEERPELSLCIHECLDDGLIAKINGRYYPKNNIRVVPTSNDKAVISEIKELITHIPDAGVIADDTQTPEVNPHKVIQAKTRRTALNPFNARKAEVLPHGNLQRTGTTGLIAYALYRIRGEGTLSLSEIKLFLSHCSNGAIYQSTGNLVASGMIEKDSSNFSKPLYKWSGTFCYPFSKQQDVDKTLVPFKDYSEFLNFKQKRALTDNLVTAPNFVGSITGNIVSKFPPDVDTHIPKLEPVEFNTYLPELPVSGVIDKSEKILDMLRMFDLKIAFFEAELISLRAMRQQLNGLL